MGCEVEGLNDGNVKLKVPVDTNTTAAVATNTTATCYLCS